MLLMLGRQGRIAHGTQGKTFRSICKPGMEKKQRPNDTPDAGATGPTLLMGRTARLSDPFANRAWGRNRGPMMLLMLGRQGPHCSWDARQDFPIHLQTGHGEETEAQ